MNREFKFRAWDLERKRFVENLTFADNRIPSNWDKWFVFQQYTGLKDRNGVEIFEGDLVTSEIAWLVSDEEAPCVVKWSEKYASFILEKNGKIDFLSSTLTGWSPRVLEVIGNINENPDLVK